MRTKNNVLAHKVSYNYVKRELIEQISYQKVTETLPKLSDYTIQVNPREINLLYLQDQLRERIIFENGNRISFQNTFCVIFNIGIY